MISSRRFTSCTSPLVTRINVGMLPCRSSKVCILTAALRRRNFAHGNSDRHRSMVVESRAYRLCSRSTPIGSRACSGRAMPINTCAKSAKILQSCDSFASASVERVHLAAETQVVQLALHRTQTGLDVAQTFPIGQLREGHGQILIPAGKSAQPDVALIALDATAKLPVGKEADQLRKNGAALIHEPLSAVPAAQASRSDVSNRGKLETDSTHYRPVACCRHTLL